MRLSVTLCSVLLLLLRGASTFHILAISTLATRSHFIWMDTVITALLTRGHRITELTFKQPAQHPNRTSFVLKSGVYKPERYSPLIDATKNNRNFLWSIYSIYEQIIVPGHHANMVSKEFQELKQHVVSRQDKIDLILIDYAYRSPLIGISQLVGYPPIVAMTAYNHPTGFNTFMGSPQLPALVPHDASPFSCEMSFSERVHNFLGFAFSWLVEYLYFEPAMEQLLRDEISSESPSLVELESNISIAMVNTHPTTHCQQESTASILEVGFLHIKPPKTLLPKDIAKFLDEGNEGVIIVSFGSMIQPHLIAGLQDSLVTVMRKSKQRFLWKTASPPENLPSNVLTSKWLSQSDILGHPNVRLLVAHGGTLSMQEAFYRGIPILIIPFFLDQQANANRVLSMGVGRTLSYSQLTAEALSQEIQSVLENVKYKEKMRLLSTIAKDQPESALQRAVFWLEFVGRHGGTPHFRKDSRRLHWLQYYSIDVIALLTFGVILILIMTVLCIQSGFRLVYTSKRKRKVQ